MAGRLATGRVARIIELAFLPGVGMVRVCRCRCGHTWVPTPAADTVRCPACGDTAPIAADLTDPHLPTVPAHEPSFSSLVGLPAVPPDPNGPTLSPERPVTGRAGNRVLE